MKHALILLSTILIYVYAAPAQAKKILILYSSGGHATAASAIANMIETHLEGNEVVTHDFAEDTSGFAHWHLTGGYDWMSRNASWINTLTINALWWSAEHADKTIDQRDLIKFIDPDPIFDYIQSVHPDVIIATHFGVGQTLAILRSRGELRDTPIAWTQLDMVDNTFFRQLGDELDMTFLPNAGMRTDWLSIMSDERVRAPGMPIMESMVTPLDKSHRAETAARLGFDPSAYTVTLMGGSMGALAYRPIIENILAQAPTGAPIQVHAICGRNSTAQTQLKSWMASPDFPRDRLRLNVTGFIPGTQLRELQAASDVIVSKPGGLTSYELLSTGMPVILTQGIGEQEVRNARYMEQVGAALYVPDRRRLGTTIRTLMSSPSTVAQLIAGQAQMRDATFNLREITDWVAQAKVTQPEPPAVSVWRRQRDQGIGSLGFSGALQDIYRRMCEFATAAAP